MSYIIEYRGKDSRGIWSQYITLTQLDITIDDVPCSKYIYNNSYTSYPPIIYEYRLTDFGKSLYDLGVRFTVPSGKLGADDTELNKNNSSLTYPVNNQDFRYGFSASMLDSTLTVQALYSGVKALGYVLPYSNIVSGNQSLSMTLYSDDSSLFDVFVDDVKVSADGGVVGYGLEVTVASGKSKQIKIRRASADETVQRDYANRWDIRFLSALGKWQQVILPVDVFEEGVPTLYPGSGSIQLPKALNQPITDQWVQVSFSGMDQKAVQPGTYQLQVLASDSTSWVPFANFDFDGAMITKVQHFGGISAGLIFAGPITQEYREIRIWATAATLPDEPPETVVGETPLPRPDPLPSQPEAPTPIKPEGPVTPITEPVEPDPEGTPIEPTAPTPTETTIPTPNTETCVCSPWYAAIAQAIVNSGAYISQAVTTIVSPIVQGVASVEKLRYELVSSIGQFLQEVESIKLNLEVMRVDLCKGVNAISPEIEKIEARLEAIQNDLYARLGEIKQDIHSIDSRLYLMDGDVEVSITDELGNISTSIENPAGLIQQEISCGVDTSGVLNVTTKSINEMES